MSVTLSALGVDDPKPISALLLDLFQSLAFYPFPTKLSSFGEAVIDENAFLRSVIHLTLNRYPAFRGLNKYEPPLGSGMGCGTVGPHRGRFTCVRAHGAADFRRRVFRGLAIPHERGSSQVTTIQVPYFEWSEPRAEGGEITMEDIITRNYNEFVIVVDEEEWLIDTMDVLSHCMPRPSRPVMPPMRDAYKLALPDLPRYTHDLTALHIPTPNLVSILNTVQSVQQKKITGLVYLVESLGISGEISWATFEYIISEHSVIHPKILEFEILYADLSPRTSFQMDSRPSLGRLYLDWKQPRHCSI